MWAVAAASRHIRHETLRGASLGTTSQFPSLTDTAPTRNIVVDLLPSLRRALWNAIVPSKATRPETYQTDADHRDAALASATAYLNSKDMSIDRPHVPLELAASMLRACWMDFECGCQSIAAAANQMRSPVAEIVEEAYDAPLVARVVIHDCEVALATAVRAEAAWRPKRRPPKVKGIVVDVHAKKKPVFSERGRWLRPPKPQTPETQQNVTSYAISRCDHTANAVDEQWHNLAEASDAPPDKETETAAHAAMDILSDRVCKLPPRPSHRGLATTLRSMAAKETDTLKSSSRWVRRVDASIGREVQERRAKSLVQHDDAVLSLTRASTPSKWDNVAQLDMEPIQASPKLRVFRPQSASPAVGTKGHSPRRSINPSVGITFPSHAAVTATRDRNATGVLDASAPYGSRYPGRNGGVARTTAARVKHSLEREAHRLAMVMEREHLDARLFCSEVCASPQRVVTKGISDRLKLSNAVGLR
jgi:hypothetical protein